MTTVQPFMKLTEILENISLVGRLDLIPSLTAKRHVLFNPFFLLATRVGRTAGEELSLIDLTCVWKAARGIRILPQHHGVALAKLSTTSSAWAEWGDPLLANTVPSLVLLPRHFFFFVRGAAECVNFISLLLRLPATTRSKDHREQESHGALSTS